MTTKRCFKCGCEKPLEGFYKHAMMADKHLNKCKECTKKDVAQHRLEHIAEIRAYDRRRAALPHRAEGRKQRAKEYPKRFPKRKAATSTLSNAVRDGKVKKQPCWVCGEQKAEAHHPDYDRPLDVVWLCVPHHRQAHALVANEPTVMEAA
jgi:hypothetical protein